VWIRALFLLWVGGVLQSGLALHCTIFGATPDFLLAILAPMCLLSSSSRAPAYGFAAGLIQGALSGANLTHYVVSRTIAAYAVARLGKTDLQFSVPLAGLASAGMTLFAHLLLMFTAPPQIIPSFIGDTIGTAVYNGVIAMPVYAFLRRFADPRSSQFSY